MSNTELVRKVFDCINAHDMAPMLEHWTADVTERFPDRTCTGADELIAYFDGLFAAMPDTHMELVHTAEEGDAVLARWRLTGTHTGAPFAGIDATGARVELDGIDHFTIRDGKIASNFVVFDQMSVARAMGLLPPDGSPADKALKAAFNAKTRIAEAIRQARGQGT